MSMVETAPSKIQVRNLNFYYGKFHALKNINLDIAKNQVTAFIGPSGCGKSTLLRTFNKMFELYPEDVYKRQIKNSVIGDDCEISPYTVVEDANLAAACTIGPFARLRPGAELLEGAHVGNFVEMKKARLGKGSKAGQLTYLGDAEIGDNVNIGAGTITCNYDGAKDVYKRQPCTR